MQHADQPSAQWRCPNCGRVLDDHQLIDIRGGWRDTPLCVEPGDIAHGIRRQAAS